ncbi:hypothetical protein [Mangrovibacterium sp.]|uniref:hypothetical protein n=1 Tax=Mangrovibacterium sp. TaxID=1961364 RepID=UPI00356B156F
MKRILFIAGLILSFSSYAQTSYYIDNQSGNDSNNGTSIYTPWKSLERVNQVKFQGGDSILFRRGGSWVGNLKLQGSGTEGKPIVMSAYGNGPLPELDARGGVASGERASCTIRLFNQEYWEFKYLKIKNFKAFEKPTPVKSEGKNVWSNAVKMGILVEARDAGTLRHIHFTGLEICDVNGDMQTKDNGGIFMEISWDEDLEQRKPTNFNDIVLQDCYIHDVDRTGFSNSSVWSNRSLKSKWGETLANGKTHNWLPSNNIVIRNNRFERTGANALIVRVAKSPVVEYNFFNRCALKGSGNASFPFNCDNALFQYNEACYTVYNSEADSWDGKKDADAGGFDSDWNCKNSVFQYNYSHHNGFGGILICCDGGSKTSFNDGTIVRYNVFEDNAEHVIRSSGTSSNTKIYNNLIYNSAEHDSVKLIFHKSWGGYSDSILYQNNIFVSRGEGCYFDLGKSTRNFFHANLFYGSIQNKPADPEAIDSNPRFIAEDGSISANSWARFLLRQGSPAIDSGLPIEQNGDLDFTGKALDSKPDRGPFEFRGNTTK